MLCVTLSNSRMHLLIITLATLLHRSYQEPNRQRHTKEALTTLLDSYGSNLIRPNGYNRTDDPVEVTINIMLLDYTSISDYDMEYGVQMFFRQEWYDDQLKYEDKGGIKYISLTEVPKVWTPDIFFPNEKNAQHHKVMSPNVLFRIYPSGKVLYSARISLTLFCHMQLSRFPFDEQSCELRMESFAHTTRDIQLKWKYDNPVQISRHASAVGFNMEKVMTSDCKVAISTGEFNCLRLTMLFHRQVIYYLWHTFLPSGVLVAISWLTFLLDRRAVLIRGTIILSALFGLGFIAAEVEATVPHVDYVKAMDIWIAGCYVFLLTALVEFVFVSARWMKEDGLSGGGKDVTATKTVDMHFNTAKDVSQVDAKYQESIYNELLKKCPKDPDYIDSLTCRVFPALFLGFASIYFFEYCF